MRRRFGLAVLGVGLLAATGTAQDVAWSSLTHERDGLALHQKDAARIVSPLTTRISVNLREVSLEQALREIARQGKIRISLGDEVYATARRVSLQKNAITIKDALDHVLANTHVGYREIPGGEFVFTKRLVAGETSRRADGVIMGRVISARTKQPVAGATVVLGAGTASVVTGNDGTFRIVAPAGEHQIHVRAMGLAKYSKSVTVSNDATVTVEVILEAVANVLNEVVVTGTVIETERKAIPTPITVITAEDIEKRGITRIDQLFRGEVPGVVALEIGVKTFSGNMGASGDQLGMMVRSEVFSRGSSTLDGNDPNPLKTYVDGVELMDSELLGTIDPSSIERIEIITGPQAATVYGSGAMGGVMQIFTKKGTGSATTDVSLDVKYGILQTNLGAGMTPAHTDVIGVTGGTGAAFAYSVTGTHRYVGQWQPGLFSRSLGGSVGITYVQGPFRATGSVAATTGRSGNGTLGFIIRKRLVDDGSIPPSTYEFFEQRIATSSSQNTALSLDYTQSPRWRHQFTMGKNQTELGIVPLAPSRWNPGDSLFKASQGNGSRTTLGYNATMMSSRDRMITSSLTVGGNGSLGQQLTTHGCTPSKSATAMISCHPIYYWEQLSVQKTMESKSWGGFGTWQIGVFDQLYLTLGLRAERNPNYGGDHKVDLTPTNGLAYTREIGDVTVKLLGSYGRSTRPPSPDMKLELISNSTGYNPPTYVYILANPDLRPEYSRGPQGGVEIYYGNMMSVTINHYQQTVTDLIQSFTVDSVPAVRLSDGADIYLSQSQYRNIAKVRQYGWESTGSLNLAPLTVKGTYSWNDSRIAAVAPGSFYQLGESAYYLPTHTGNVTVSYAHGGTSLLISTSYIGGSRQWFQNMPIFQIRSGGRVRMYAERAAGLPSFYRQDGYIKSDLTASQRVNSAVRVTLGITNLGNSFSSDQNNYPALGRQTQLGVNVRFPRR